MGPAFAAVGAGVAALLELTIASRYQINGAQLLQVSLVFAIAVTVVYGFEEGMVWAFVGGLCLDLLAIRPLGHPCSNCLLPLPSPRSRSPCSRDLGTSDA